MVPSPLLTITMHLVLSCLVLLFHISATVCQRYAERNPVPLEPNPVPPKAPFEDHYGDDDYTEGYDFLEEKDIYRWNVDKFPQPQEDYQFCNRLKPSYICDPDQVLQKEEADKLDSFIRQMYKETPCICDQCKSDDGGIVVGIAILKNMYLPYNQHPSKTIRAFAEDLRQRWKLGKCDNDILIVVATTDRLSFTDVGRATSTHVSLEEAHRIFLENKGYLSAGKYYEGLRAMLDDYYTKTRTMKMLSPSVVKESTNVGLISGVIVGVILLLGVVLFVTLVVYRRCRRNKDPEKAVDNADKSEGVASSWSKRDFKFMFSSMKSHDKPQHSSAVYQPCETDEKEDPSSTDFKIEEEVIDTNLALPTNLDETQLTTTTTADDTTTPEMLDKELTVAVEGITQTFNTFQPKREFRGHETDL